MKIALGALLILHGLIVAAQSSGTFNRANGPVGVANPSWVSWWPTRLGQSWLLSGLGLERSVIVPLSGLLWIIGGVALVAAGLGAFGFIIPTAWWRDLALAGAGVSLFMLVVYLHPLMIVGIASSLAV